MQDRDRTLLVILGLTAIACAVFGQVGGFEFVNYDDNCYVSGNEHISSGFTIQNIIWVFTSVHCGNWHPLTGLSHMLDCELFGLNAGRHHLVNVAIHIINTLLVFVVFQRMTDAFWRSAFIAAVFSLHPMHVESVAWISERKDVLSTFFGLLTMAAYLYYIKNPNFNRYALMTILFALGLMAKPMLVTLPCVLLLLDYWPLERFGKIRLKKLIAEKIPLLALSAASSAITMIVQSQSGAIAGIRRFPLSVCAFNSLLSYIRYLVKMVWPVNLALFYPLAGDKQVWWQVFGSGVIFAGVTLLALRHCRKRKYLLTGWFWYVGTLVPVIGLVQVGEQSMADRYTYIPFIGLFIVVAWGANDLLAEWKYGRVACGLLSSAIVLTLAVLSWFQASYWHDSISLAEHSIKVVRNNYVAYYNLANAYYEKGEYDLAIFNFSRAVEINPLFYDAYYNRANAYRHRGQLDLAISDFDKAIEINPMYAEAYYNRAIVYKNLGQLDRAISDYSKTIEITPADADAYNNRGNVYRSKGEYDLAVADYDKAIEINPQCFLAWFNKAGVYESMGRKTEAVELYKTFVKYAPPVYTPYIDLAKQKLAELSK